MNEELHTLNTEHQSKIQELVEVNDDLNNYFRSTDIGQIMLDRQLRIRKFNPAAVRLVNLIDSDIGRPIGHISTNQKYDSLVDDIPPSSRKWNWSMAVPTSCASFLISGRISRLTELW